MKTLHRILSGTLLACIMLCPCAAHAEWGIVDSLNLAPFVPLVLDAFMTVATGGYEFLVRDTNGHMGIIYVLIWGFLAISMGLYLVKMYFPSKWLGVFGFSGGGEMISGKATGMTIAQNMLKPAMRAIIAAVVLLQIKPIYVTEWLVNPFMEFGAIYTDAITSGINTGGITGGTTEPVECPQDILSQGWISARSCTFITQPVADISHVNNQMIKRGLDFVHRGLRGLITLIPHGGTDFMNLVSGILLVVTFVGCNLFMALLIIQAIFDFGMSLILYPFQVLTWVAKPKNPDKWFDVWPAFSGIIKALQSMVITMIACAFILTINIAIIRALFNWNNSVFVVAAGGSASSNVPTPAGTAMGFGEHSILWLSAILTFYLMLRIFNLTRERLSMYAPAKDTMYKKVTGDTKRLLGDAKNWGKTIGRAAGWIKKK
ncbi:hypothetical protein HDR61_01390 [bacterium]|nr:hypothetical protein [bacterium]